jgi:hypothetical protein
VIFVPCLTDCAGWTRLIRVLSQPVRHFWELRVHEGSNETTTPEELPMSESLDAAAVPAPSDGSATSAAAGTSEVAQDSGASAGAPGASTSAASAASAEPVVAALTPARMPADRGLSSLGLLMQLGGTIGMTVAAVIAIAASVTGGAGGTGMLFLFAVLSGLRSAFHRAAGSALIYGEGKAATRAVFTYIWTSIGHGALSVMILHSFVDSKVVFQFGALLLCWPITLLIYFTRPHIKALIAGGVPDPEDHGFEGAAVLMTVFGIVGALFAGLVLMVLLEDPGAAFATPASGIVVLVFAVLVVRSIIHALAGFKGISGADFDECNASAGRYYGLGIVSALVIGITLFMVILLDHQEMGAALIIGAFSTLVLLAWPVILRRLYAERNFNVFLAGAAAPTFQRAPDAGLIALGWVLVALAVFGMGQALGEAIFGTELSPDELAMLVMSSDGEAALAMLDRSPWWSVGLAGVQLWAGIELVRMTERHKLAAMIYGAVTIAVTLYLIWPLADQLDSLFADVLGSGVGAMVGKLLTGAVGFNLILAIAAMVLVNRVTVPSAVVHLRKHKP